MKNLADILPEIEKIKKALDTQKELSKEGIFSLLEKCPEVQKVMSDFSNLENGYYSFDEHSELIYCIELPKNLKNIPYIGEFLTNDFGSFKRDIISQYCGECITIHWNHSRGSYFVYDHDTKKPIIRSSEGLDEKLVGLMIEKYQRDTGVFGDVVEVDYYGNYIKHFEYRHSQLSDGELNAMLDLIKVLEEA